MIVAGSGAAGQPGSGATPGRQAQTATGAGEFLVTVNVEDASPATAAGDASALTLEVDAVPVQEMLLFPGSGVSSYRALVGPLPHGRHVVAVRPSRLWPPDTRISIRGVAVEPVSTGPDRDVYRFAPRIGLRTDTVGAMSDLPMHMYCERADASLRYSLVFTNEDGGTASRPLMARWGRAVDIEFVYEAVVRDGRLISGTYQGPDHKMLPYRGPADPPLLNVVTLNNMFLDRGRARATVRPVPEVVDLTNATRESVLDRQPWMYRVMAGELKREGKLGTVVDDPRRYVYAEARLALKDAVVAARAGLSDGTWRASHHGEIELTINRDGWVRTAVPLAEARPDAVQAIAWECLPIPGRASRGHCEIHAARAFTLGDDYIPGSNLVSATTLRLRAGEMGEVERGPRGQGQGARAVSGLRGEDSAATAELMSARH